MQQTYGWLNNCLHRIFKNSLFAILILSWLTLLFYKCDCTKWGWLLIKLNKFSCEWFWWKMHFLKLLQLITTESFQVYWIWIVVLRLFKIIFKGMTLLLKWKFFPRRHQNKSFKLFTFVIVVGKWKSFPRKVSRLSQL